MRVVHTEKFARPTKSEVEEEARAWRARHDGHYWDYDSRSLVELNQSTRAHTYIITISCVMDSGYAQAMR
jgi:hypothetical protein